MGEGPEGPIVLKETGLVELSSCRAPDGNGRGLCEEVVNLGGQLDLQFRFGASFEFSCLAGHMSSGIFFLSR